MEEKASDRTESSEVPDMGGVVSNSSRLSMFICFVFEANMAIGLVMVEAKKMEITVTTKTTPNKNKNNIEMVCQIWLLESVSGRLTAAASAVRSARQ